MPRGRPPPCMLTLKTKSLITLCSFNLLDIYISYHLRKYHRDQSSDLISPLQISNTQ